MIAVLLIGAIYAVGVLSLPIVSCELNRHYNVIPYEQVMQLWQTIFGMRLEAGRAFSILLSVITLALLYKIASIAGHYKAALWTVLLGLSTPSILLVLGWNSPYMWLALLTLLSGLCTMQSVTRSSAVILLYSVGFLLLLSGLWVVFLSDLLFLCIASKKNRWLAVAGLVAIAAWLAVSKPTVVSRDLFTALLQPTHISFWIIWLLGLSGVLPLLRRQETDSNFTKIAQWLIIGLIVPLLAWILLPFDPILLIISILFFSLIACGYALSVLSGRIQLTVIGLLVVGMLMSRWSEQNVDVLRFIQSVKADAATVTIALPESCLQENNVASLLYQNGLMLVYLHRENNPWIAVAPDRSIRHLDQLPASGQYQWVIEPLQSPGIAWPSNSHIVFKRDYSETRLTLYYTAQSEPITADHAPIALVGELALLEFQVHPSVKIHAGDAFIVDTWWTTKTYPQDDYLLSLNLDDTAGQPIAVAGGAVADTFTARWMSGTVYSDQRVVNIPRSIAPGDYNLVMTVHGTSDTANRHFSHMNGTDAGEYIYLTTIMVIAPNAQ